VRISPIWNPELEAITGKTFSDVERLYKKVYAFYRRSFPD
jgi:hypothetical protein